MQAQQDDFNIVAATGTQRLGLQFYSKDFPNWKYFARVSSTSSEGLLFDLHWMLPTLMLFLTFTKKAWSYP